MTETWKPIPGFPGYEASDFGQARSYYHRMSQGQAKGPLWEIVTDIPPTILKGTSPYRKISLKHESGKYVNRAISHFILLTFTGPCPNGLEICHKDGDPTNNYIGNLRYDTRQNNRLDIPPEKRHATACRAARNRVYQKPEVRQAIMARLAKGEYAAYLARKFDIPPSTISKWRRKAKLQIGT